mgnify:CR=1 FL=1
MKQEHKTIHQRFGLTVLFSAIVFLILLITSLLIFIVGILLILAFYVLIDRPLASLVWVTLTLIFLGYAGLVSNFSSSSLPQLATALTALPGSAPTQLYALAALPLIYLPMNTGIKVNKYVFYAFYPIHPLLIYLIKLYV